MQESDICFSASCTVCTCRVHAVLTSSFKMCIAEQGHVAIRALGRVLDKSCARVSHFRAHTPVPCHFPFPNVCRSFFAQCLLVPFPSSRMHACANSPSCLGTQHLSFSRSKTCSKSLHKQDRLHDKASCGDGMRQQWTCDGDRKRRTVCSTQASSASMQTGLQQTRRPWPQRDVPLHLHARPMHQGTRPRSTTRLHLGVARCR